MNRTAELKINEKICAFKTIKKVIIMSSIFPIYISADRQNWIIGMAAEDGISYLCSSIKLRNSLNQKFRDSGQYNTVAQHFKEAARSFIDAIKQVTGKTLEAIKFTDGKGKFLNISPTSFEHNFEPSDGILQEDESVNSRKQKQIEIIERLKSLA